MIGLAQVQAFLEVAQSGSFANASRRLSLPRSTVSARIRALEEALQVRLLHRTTRRVALTDEGRRYMERCQDAIEKLALAQAELMPGPNLSGTIRLTVPVDMPKRALSELLGRFVGLYPALRVEVTITDEALDLIDNNLDVALRGGAPGASGLVARKLGQCDVAFHASPQYVAKRLPTRALTDYSRHVIYDPARRSSRRQRAGMQPEPIGTRNFELAKTLAMQSQGIALLPENICKEEVRSGSLVRLSCAEPIPALPLYLVMPSRTHLPARVRAFIDFVTQPEICASLL